MTLVKIKYFKCEDQCWLMSTMLVLMISVIRSFTAVNLMWLPRLMHKDCSVDQLFICLIMGSSVIVLSENVCLVIHEDCWWKC